MADERDVKAKTFAYFTVAGFGPCLSGKVEIHDDLLLLLHLLLFLCRVVSNAIQPAIVVAGIEVLVVKLSSRGSGGSSVTHSRVAACRNLLSRWLFW